jgi:hypothetical protein
LPQVIYQQLLIKQALSETNQQVNHKTLCQAKQKAITDTYILTWVICSNYSQNPSTLISQNPSNKPCKKLSSMINQKPYSKQGQQVLPKAIQQA